MEERAFTGEINLLRDRLGILNQYVSELSQTPQQSEFLCQIFGEVETRLSGLETLLNKYHRRESSLRKWAEHSALMLTSFDDELGILSEEDTFAWVERMLDNLAQKQQMESILQYRVAFESLLTQISTQFINLTSKEIDQGINQALKAIGEFTFVDRIYIYSSDGKQGALTHEWCAVGIPSSFNNELQIPKDTFLWIAPQLMQFQTVYIPCVDELPEAAEAEKLILKALDVKTFVAVPLVYDSVLIGVLCFSSLVELKVWSEEDLALLSTLGDIFASTLARKYVETAIRESEERFRQLVDNIDDVFWMYSLEDKRPIYVSPVYEKIWNRTCKSVYEEAFSWLSLIHPDDQKQASLELEAWQRGERTNLEYRVVRPNGEIRWISDRAFPIRNQQGIVYRYAGIAEDISERKLAFEQLQASLKDKEVLLQEIHHRVKNNLQIISSLLYLQANRIEDNQAREFLQDSRNRIESMALVHETLYRKIDFVGVNFAEYVQNLAVNLFNLYKITKSSISFQVSVSPEILINLDQAIPCGLIINELITNALKHSFKKTKAGIVFVSLETNSNQQLVLEVGNNGDRLPPNFQLEQTQSMGLRLVMTLVKQLQGTLELNQSDFITFTIVFPSLR
ncbi:MAG: histidine kinase dimerization/phosphoacceptor domain -containing protein [Coleofasciculaceae cyanobacterium]